MLRKPIMFCGFTAMMGIFGAFVRWLQNTQGFEADTGLAVTFSPLHFVMLAYLLAFAGWLFWYTKKLEGSTMPQKYPESFACPTKLWQIGSVVFSAVMILGALALALNIFRAMRISSGVAAVYENLWQKLSSLGLVFDIILAVFAIICAICFLSFSDGANGKNPRNGGAASIVIVIFFCYRLISTYKTFASDPVVWHFAVQILAVSASLLAFYFVAGFNYSKPKMRSALYFSLLGAFLSIISVADGSVSTGSKLISIATAGMLLLVSYAELRNIKPIEPAPAEPEIITDTPDSLL